MKAQPSRLLVIGPSWVGDMVMAHSLFQLLKQHYPELVIDVLAPGWSLPLLQRMPEVNQGLELPWGHGAFKLRERIAYGKSLRSAGYDWCIVLPNSLKSAIVPFAAGIPRRTGFIGEARWGLLNDARRLDKQRLTMTVQRFLALGLAPGEALPAISPPRISVNEADVQASLDKFSLQPGRVLALCPGAEYGPAKQWPAEYYAEVAREKSAQGWQVWLFGSHKDQAVCAEIDQLSEVVCFNLAGHTQLGEAVDLLSCADLVVSNDSGLMHVAAALDRKLIAVYGSSDPGFTPPLNTQARIAYLGLSCSPCFKRTCPLEHLDCLRQLRPQQILKLAEEIPE